MVDLISEDEQWGDVRDKINGIAHVNIEQFGARESGSSSINNTAIQSALDAAPETKRWVIEVPSGRSYAFDDVYLTKKNVSLVGGGQLVGGTLNIGVLPYTATQSDINAFSGLPSAMELDAKIRDITFIGSDGDGVPAIRLAYAREVTLDSISTINCDYAVDCFGSNGDNFSQSVARVRISKGQFSRAVTPIRLRKGAGNAAMHFADFTIAQSHMIDRVLSGVSAKMIRNVDIEGIDGLICIGNYMFMSANGDELADKAENIKISIGTNISIGMNQLFEAGTESVLLDRVKTGVVQGNIVAFPGQRVVSPGIRVTGGDNIGDIYSTISLSGNSIEGPSGHGIRIDAGCDYVNVGPNTMVSLGSSSRFYGIGSPLGASAYDVSRDSAMKNTVISKQASAALEIQRSVTITQTGDSQTIEIGDASVVFLNPATQLNVSAFTRFGSAPTNPEDGFVVHCTASGGVKIYAGSAIVLPDGVHRNLVLGDEIAFTVNSDGKLYPKSIAVKDRAISASGTGTGIVLDIGDGKSVIYSPGTATTIAQFTKNALPLEQRGASYDVSMICTTGNATLIHDATKMNCPGAVDLPIPSGGVVQIRNLNGKVYVKPFNF